MHVPVMLHEAMEFLDVQTDGYYIDATLGQGGHAARVLERLRTGKLLGIDCDPTAVRLAQERMKPSDDRFLFLEGNFEDIDKLHAEAGLPPVQGVLADLGLSSLQLEDAQRGFSFSLPGPLDMRMNPAQPRTAADYVNRSSERDLANLFFQLGEERYSRRIARAVMKARPFRITTELAQVVTRAVPSRAGLHQFSRNHSSLRPMRCHPATRIFQALRIAVNRELDTLATFLKKVPEVLATGGRLVVISFHSLEDRLVKQAFQAWKREGSFRLLTRKVVRPGAEEVQSNPRSRSACLRAAEKLELAKSA